MVEDINCFEYIDLNKLKCYISMAEDTCWITVTISQLSNHDVHIQINSVTWTEVLVATMIQMYTTHCNGDLVHKVLITSMATALDTKLLDDIHDSKVNDFPAIFTVG